MSAEKPRELLKVQANCFFDSNNATKRLACIKEGAGIAISGEVEDLEKDTIHVTFGDFEKILKANRAIESVPITPRKRKAPLIVLDDSSQ